MSDYEMSVLDEELYQELEGGEKRKVEQGSFDAGMRKLQKQDNLSALDVLPNEIYEKILNNLRPIDLKNLRETSKGLYEKTTLMAVMFNFWTFNANRGTPPDFILVTDKTFRLTIKKEKASVVPIQTISNLINRFAHRISSLKLETENRSLLKQLSDMKPKEFPNLTSLECVSVTLDITFCITIKEDEEDFFLKDDVPVVPNVSVVPDVPDVPVVPNVPVVPDVPVVPNVPVVPDVPDVPVEPVPPISNLIIKFAHRISSLKLDTFNESLLKQLCDMKSQEFPKLTSLECITEDIKKRFFSFVLMVAPQLEYLNLDGITDDILSVDDGNTSYNFTEDSKCFTKLKTLKVRCCPGKEVNVILTKCHKLLEHLVIDFSTLHELGNFNHKLSSLKILDISFDGNDDGLKAASNLISKCATSLNTLHLHLLAQFDISSVIGVNLNITTLKLLFKSESICIEEVLSKKCPFVQNLVLCGYNKEIKKNMYENIRSLKLIECNALCISSVLKQVPNLRTLHIENPAGDVNYLFDDSDDDSDDYSDDYSDDNSEEDSDDIWNQQLHDIDNQVDEIEVLANPANNIHVIANPVNDIDVLANPVDDIDVLANPVDGIDVIANPVDNIDVIANPVDNIEVIANPVDDIDVMANPVDNIDDIANPVDNIDVLANPVDDIDVIANPVDDIDVIANPVDDIAVMANPVNDIDVIANPVDDIDVIANPVDDIEVIANPVDYIEDIINPVDYLTDCVFPMIPELYTVWIHGHIEEQETLNHIVKMFPKNSEVQIKRVTKESNLCLWGTKMVMLKWTVFRRVNNSTCEDEN